MQHPPEVLLNCNAGVHSRDRSQPQKLPWAWCLRLRGFTPRKCPLIFFGTGCVAALKVAGASFGLWEISIIWGVGVSMAIYLTAGVRARTNLDVRAACTVERLLVEKGQVVGFLGQGVFTARFLVQWVASEKKGDSVVPVALTRMRFEPVVVVDWFGASNYART